MNRFLRFGHNCTNLLNIRCQEPQIYQCGVYIQHRFKSKSDIDYSLFPRLQEDDVEEQFVRGNGPGGQAVNKTANCVVLKHLPTGLVVKCHASRSMDQNRRLARELMLTRLDKLFNGDNSVEAQSRRLQLKKLNEANRRKRRVEEMKRKWESREQTLITKKTT